MFDKNLLFLSAFGKACNMAVRGGAVDEKFDRAFIDNAVAPWCSATPLSGELLQVSLDALLQNDINLLSAYPDAYVSQSYDGTKAHNGEQFCYFPAGDGQGIETGEDTWNNSVTLSATIGSITGDTETSAVVLGSLVPAYPFKHGKEWNYGVFGVSAGKPTWYDIDVSALTKFDMEEVQSVVGGYSAVSGKINDAPRYYMMNGYWGTYPDAEKKLIETTMDTVYFYKPVSTSQAQPTGFTLGIYKDQNPVQVKDYNAWGYDTISIASGDFKSGEVIDFDVVLSKAVIASGDTNLSNGYKQITNLNDAPTLWRVCPVCIPDLDGVTPADPEWPATGALTYLPYYYYGMDKKLKGYVTTVEWSSNQGTGAYSRYDFNVHLKGTITIIADYVGRIGVYFQSKWAYLDSEGNPITTVKKIISGTTKDGFDPNMTVNLIRYSSKNLNKYKVGEYILNDAIMLPKE